MDSIIIATTKTWNIDHAERLRKTMPECVVSIVSDRNDLAFDRIQKINPKYIFFPHWSWIIPPDIYENFNCVLFHMTDLPFGRGGSPLQNLISRGITETQITAIKVSGGIDTGDIYIKEPLNLNGGAEEIYIRAADIVFNKMIPYILSNNPVAIPQSGQPVIFARRTPEMSKLSSDMSISQVYDHIRMLDAEGYPKAYIEFGEYKLSFSRPKLTSTGLQADVFMEVNDDTTLKY